MTTDSTSDYQSLRDRAERLTADLNQLRLDEALLAGLLFGDDQAAGKDFRAIAAQLRAALGHLDAIIAAYQTTNALGPLINACRAAKEWRGVNEKPKTAQDASGAIQSP